MVDRVDPERRLVIARCRGDNAEVYNLGHDPSRAPHWRCSCAELRGKCSHLRALKLVVVLP
jgi:hypothetical protein